jgi:hypothetical protein
MGSLHEDQYTFVIKSRSVLPRLRKVVEKTKDIYVQYFF